MNKQLLLGALDLVLVAALMVLSSGRVTALQPSSSVVDLKARLWADDSLLLPSLSRSSHPDGPAPDPGASPISVSGLGDWTRIAFESYRDDNWEIYLARGDGSLPARLTADPQSDVLPRLNRGATRAVFASDRAGNYDIYAVNVDGSGLARLTADEASDTSPAWSPDSNRIVFSSKRDGNYEIYAMNSNGSAPARLTVGGGDDIMPAWSPDGGKIAWVRKSGSAGAIWVMNADGANPHSLTPTWPFLQNPVWSPDGTLLAFDYDADGDDWNEVAIMNADGSGLHTVWDAHTDMVDVWMGSWSPNGQWLLFSYVTYAYQGQLYIRSAEVYQVLTNGGRVTKLVSSGYDMTPDWQTEDLAPPRSQVSRLPQYSRASNIPIRWSGTDIGQAGIVGYDVQYRSGVGGRWTGWFTNTSSTSAPFTGLPGTTVAFRSRATDDAGNIEAWPPGDGDTSTTLFTWKLDGQVTDNRGRPLARVPLSIAPTPLVSALTDANGYYTARFTTTGAFSLGISHAGYASQPARSYDLSSDISQSFYLRPLDDVVKNGGFEADAHALTGWTVRGTLPAVITTTIRHTGAQAATVGLPCPFPCLAETEEIPFSSVSNVYPYDIATDASGALHVVWWSGGPVLYGYRTPQGDWMGPYEIAYAGSGGELPGASVAVDGSGIVHAVWNNTQRALFYSQKTPSGDWTAPFPLGPGVEVDLAADSNGGVHLIYRCYECAGAGRIYYTERLPPGVWAAPRALDTGNGYMRPGITVGPDDTVHLIWQEINGGIYYQGRSADGTWSTKDRLFSGDGYTFDKQQIVAGPQGELFALWSWAYSGYYATKAPGGTWSAPEAIASARGEADVVIDDQGTVHLISTSSLAADEGTYYRRKALGEAWSAIVKLSADYHTGPAVAVDRFEVLHALLFFNPSTHYLTWRRSAEAGEGSLSQVVTVPSGMHRPTLACEYKLTGAIPGSGSGIQVRLSDGSASSQVPLPMAGAGLSLAWVDIGSWAGKTVTVTFAAAQAAGQPHIRFFLDDVSLGSWLTPIVSSVSPSRIQAWSVTPITITGDNYVAGPTVHLNDTTLADAHWVSTATLTATVPALPPGMYDLWVANPGGQDGVLPGGLIVGKLVYLPIVLKEHAQ